MDPSEPHWRMNSSFPPPHSRRWDSMFQSDGLSRGMPDAAIFESSCASHNKGGRSGENSDQFPNHQHSVSDGAVSFYESPFHNFQAPHWSPSMQRYDLDEFSTPSGGARAKASILSFCNERRYPTGISSMPNSLGSTSSPLESRRWASTSKQHLFFPPHNFSGRRSFMSKPVCPLVFRDPVSDGNPSVSSWMVPGDSTRNSPLWPESTFSPDLKFHKTLSDLEKMEASPETGASSRREGFRWSNASSYDFGFDGDAIDITERISPKNLRSPNNSARYQKCGLCGRLLQQKSPWSSYRIVRNADMPIAGILPCRHVFHAECLEETTPASQAHEPPCPVCLKAVSSEDSQSFSKPLQVALTSVCRNGVDTTSNGAGSSCSPSFDHNERDLKRNQSVTVVRSGGSLIKDHFKKRFSLKGKDRKGLFSAKVFGRTRLSSSSLLFHDSKRRS